MIPRLPDFEKARNVIETGLGGIVNGRFIFCGLDVNAEIGGRMTQTEVLLLWLLGRKPEPLETRLMDALITVNTYPDIRIWCIRAGAYAAAAGSPVSSAYAAAHALLNAKLFGVQASLSFRRFLTGICIRTEHEKLETIIDGMVARKAFFPGFGRPLIQGRDERIERITALLQEWQYPLGRHCRILLEMAGMITAKTGLHPNYASLFVALLLDPPFGLDDVGLAAAAHFIVNMAAMTPACEAAGMDAGKPLLPQSIDDIDYQGAAPRKLRDTGNARKD